MAGSGERAPGQGGLLSGLLQPGAKGLRQLPAGEGTGIGGFYGNMVASFPFLTTPS